MICLRYYLNYFKETLCFYILGIKQQDTRDLNVEFTLHLKLQFSLLMTDLVNWCELIQSNLSFQQLNK